MKLITRAIISALIARATIPETIIPTIVKNAITLSPCYTFFIAKWANNVNQKDASHKKR
jgi:hypothetical protein